MGRNTRTQSYNYSQIGYTTSHIISFSYILLVSSSWFPSLVLVQVWKLFGVVVCEGECDGVVLGVVGCVVVVVVVAACPGLSVLAHAGLLQSPQQKASDHPNHQEVRMCEVWVSLVLLSCTP